jgi:hypothetical protein
LLGGALLRSSKRWFSASLGPIFGLATWVAFGRTASGQPSNDGASDDALSIEAGRCLSAQAVTTGLRAWRGDRRIDERLRFAIVERGDSVAIVVYRDGEKAGARDFAVGGRTCSDVVRMVSLSVAIMIDQALLGARASPTQESETPPPEEPAKPPPRSSPATSSARKPPALRQQPRTPATRPRALAFGLDAPTSVVSLGTLPAHAFGVGSAFVVGVKEHFEGSFSVTALRSALTPFGPARLEGLLVAAGLDICLREPIWERGFRVHAAACGGITVGALEARPRGFRDAYSATLPYSAASLGMKLVVDLADGSASWRHSNPSRSRMALFVSSVLWIPFASPQFELQSQTGALGSLLWQPHSVGLVFRLGPEFQF